ncbi:uncharacterized protein [Paramisgurnus dabryanus]|uniref:uncharacterized protein n=1 Tax=Paramisgurnus dabryanus TaxID=90735 RepID=UPI003CCF9F7A
MFPRAAPNRGEPAVTSQHGARLSSMPSGCQCVNPAAVCVSGHSGFIFLCASCAGHARPLSEEGGINITQVEPCQFGSGHRGKFKQYTKSQSREAGPPYRKFGSVETPAKRVSVGFANNKKGLQNSVLQPATPFQRRVIYHSGCWAGSNNGTRSRNSLVQGSHRMCSSSQQGVRVLQPLFHSSKERRGVTSDFRSTSSEPVCCKTKVQDVNYKADRHTNQIRGLVCDDRSKRRVFPHIYPPAAQEIPEVRLRGRGLPISGSPFRSISVTPYIYKVHGCSAGSITTPGHPCLKLHRRLANFSPIREYGSAASRCCADPYERTGVKAKCKEKHALSSTEDSFSWRYMGFNDNAGTSVPCSCGIHSFGCRQSEVRPVTHCKTISEVVGPHGSSIQCDTPWAASHETATVVAQNQRVFPEGQPVPSDQGHAQMSSCLRSLEETMVSLPRTDVGGSVPSSYADNGCFPHRLGSNYGEPSGSWIMGGQTAQLAHKLPRDDGSVLRPEMFHPSPAGPSRVSPDRQHVGSRVHQPPGGFAFTPFVQIGAPYPSVDTGEVAVPQSSVHSRVSESGSRRPVETGAEARGVEAPPSGGGVHLGEILPGGSGSVCVQRDDTLSAMVFSHTSSTAGTGCHGSAVAEATAVRFSPDRSAPGSSGEGSSQQRPLVVGSPTLAEPDMVLGPGVPPRRLTLGNTRQEGSPLSGGWLDSSPPPRVMETVGLASEGARLIESGLSAEAAETILHSRAPSTRKLYAFKWRVFTSWCSKHLHDPVNCPIGTVLEFLQEKFTAGLSPSTLKVYVAAISAYHVPLVGQSLGRDPLVVRFLRGTRRLRPVVRPRVPAWDLAVVLEGLSMAPFEPIETVPVKFVALKTVLLLAVTSLRRVGDLQALSVSPTCLEFAPGMVKAFLYPRPSYVPKVPTNVPRPVVLQALCPPPFRDRNQEKLNLVCPVRALDAYVHRSSLWRRSEQLFVCFGSPKKGLPATKQTLSKWIVETISLAYETTGRPSPIAVRAHSTRGMAASKALWLGASMQDVCDAAGWSSPLTFVRFYELDVGATPGAQVLMS